MFSKVLVRPSINNHTDAFWGTMYIDSLFEREAHILSVRRIGLFVTTLHLVYNHSPVSPAHK